MKFYFAPLVGVTGFVYRNAHNAMFQNVDKYFAPFISPQETGAVKQKEIEDILPKNNKDTVVIPQILSNNAAYVIQTQIQLKELGYDEVNLNLGCPSAPVVSRGRGSGFLAKKDELNAFLEEIFAANITKVSVKTRIGKDKPEEFYDLLDIYNRYPMEELIIHPRVQKDFYKNTPNRKIFLDAFAASTNPVCYNGDINTVEDYKGLLEDCPKLNHIMLGRGLLANPGLINEISTGVKVDMETLIKLHALVYADYKRVIIGEESLLSRMKQFWFYLSPCSEETMEIWSRVKGCRTMKEYDSIRFYELIAK